MQMSVWIREVLAPFSLDTLVISSVQHKNSTEFDLPNVRKYISITMHLTQIAVKSNSFCN